MPHVHYGSTSRPGISSPERSSCQPRLRQTRRSLPSSCPFTGPITSQLAFCTGVRHAMPPRLPPRQCPVNKQIGARTMVPEAALTYSHGDPRLSGAVVHPMNDSVDTTHKCRQRYTSALLPITRVVSCCRSLLSGLGRHVTLIRCRTPTIRQRVPLFTWPLHIPPHFWGLSPHSAPLACF